MNFSGYSTVIIAAVVIPFTVFSTSLIWWKSNEYSRSRKQNEGEAQDRPILPSPCRLLPTWFGFLGGHTLLISKSEKISHHLEKWADELGGDYRLDLFGVRIVVVTHYKDIRRILSLRPSKFKRDLSSGLMLWAGNQFGLIPSLFFDEGKNWGRSRRIISPSLTKHNIASIFPVVAKVGERLCTKLGAQADADEIVDANQIFGRFTHDVIALGLLGMDENSVEATKGRPCRSYEAMSSAMESMSHVTAKPEKMLGWLTMSSILPWARRIKQHAAEARKFIRVAIEAARCANQCEREPLAKDGEGESAVEEDTSHTENSGMFIRKIVGTRNGYQDSSGVIDVGRMMFDEHEMIAQMKCLFIAGTATTGLAVSWVIYYLIKFPGKFARCREEALRVAPMSKGMISTMDQYSKLVYCSAAFREAMRLRPALPFLFFQCTDDHTLNSQLMLKKGTSVAVLTRHSVMSEENFTRPKEFVPERWIDAEREGALINEGGTGGNGSINHEPDAFLGFGCGPRACPGKDLGTVNAVTILAAIIARFDVSIAPGQPDPPVEVYKSTLEPERLGLIFKRTTES